MMYLQLQAPAEFHDKIIMASMLLLHGSSTALVIVALVPALATARATYPVSAAWMFGRDSTAGWDESLANFSAIGGGGVWMFANSVGRTSAAAIRANPLTQPCMVGKQPCADAAAAALAGRNVSVRSYLTYSQATQFSPAALTPCAGVAGS
eukprot:SAG11_NODE_12834_length_683_cov_0.837329_1_plen_150_part_10